MLTYVLSPCKVDNAVFPGTGGSVSGLGRSGRLRGAGEAVRVALEQDGWWYSGKAAVPLEAMAAVVPWPCASRTAGGDFLRVAPRRRTGEDDPQEPRFLLADRNRRRISRSAASKWIPARRKLPGVAPIESTSVAEACGALAAIRGPRWTQESANSSGTVRSGFASNDPQRLEHRGPPDRKTGLSTAESIRIG
jgi:hypothetical protein